MVAFDAKKTLFFVDNSLADVLPIERVNYLSENIDHIDRVERAVMFSMQAWVEQRVGKKEFAETSFQHAKLLLAPYLTDFSNIMVAVALLHFASYSLARKKYDTAKMYLNMVVYFIDGADQSNSIVTGICTWYKFLSLGMNFTIEYETNSARGIVRFFPKMLEELLSGSGFMANFLKNFDISNFTFDVQPYITHFKPILFGKFKSMQPSNQTHIELLEMMIFLMINGYKLATMVCNGGATRDELWKIASAICNVAYRPIFPTIPHLILPFVDLAISVHSSLASTSDVDKIFSLMQDLNLIRTLNNQFDRVEQHYANVERNLQYIVSIQKY